MDNHEQGQGPRGSGGRRRRGRRGGGRRDGAPDQQQSDASDLGENGAHQQDSPTSSRPRKDSRRGRGQDSGRPPGPPPGPSNPNPGGGGIRRSPGATGRDRPPGADRGPRRDAPSQQRDRGSSSERDGQRRRDERGRPQRDDRSDRGRPQRDRGPRVFEAPVPQDEESIRLGAAFREAQLALRDCRKQLEKRKAEFDDEPEWMLAQLADAERAFEEAATAWSEHLAKTGRKVVRR